VRVAKFRLEFNVNGAGGMSILMMMDEKEAM